MFVSMISLLPGKDQRVLMPFLIPIIMKSSDLHLQSRVYMPCQREPTFVQALSCGSSPNKPVTLAILLAYMLYTLLGDIILSFRLSPWTC